MEQDIITDRNLSRNYPDPLNPDVSFLCFLRSVLCIYDTYIAIISGMRVTPHVVYYGLDLAAMAIVSYSHGIYKRGKNCQHCKPSLLYNTPCLYNIWAFALFIT